MSIALPDEPRFERLLCAVDGSPGACEAIHHAISLCTEGSELRFAAVCRENGSDPSLPPELTEMQARNALELALASASRAGVGATATLLRGTATTELLLAAAADHDLLVVAYSRRQRRSTPPSPLACLLAERAPCSVLLARPAGRRADRRPPARIVEPPPDPAAIPVLLRELAAADPAPLLLLREGLRSADVQVARPHVRARAVDRGRGPEGRARRSGRRARRPAAGARSR